MENMRKTMKVRVTTNEKEFLKSASRSIYINHNIYGKNLVAIHEKKEIIKLNKRIYAECAVLELSKLVMYEFYYDFLKQKCQIVNFLYMDTDSFIIEIIGKNFDDKSFKSKRIF